MRQSRRGHQAVWMSFAVALSSRVTVLVPAAHGDMPRRPAIAQNGCDNDWSLATRDGSGRAYDVGVRTMADSPAGLFVRTTNLVDGAAILRSRGEPCTAAPRTAATGLRRRPRAEAGRPFAAEVAAPVRPGLGALQPWKA
jgi:hypothetical protein